MKKILELDPSNDQARKAIFRLEPRAAEKREKMKEEMIGKFILTSLLVEGIDGLQLIVQHFRRDPHGSLSIMNLLMNIILEIQKIPLINNPIGPSKSKILHPTSNKIISTSLFTI